MFKISNALTDCEFKQIVEQLGSNCSKVGIIDSQLREVNLSINRIITPSIMTKIGEKFYELNGEVQRSNINILHLLPEYIVYLEPISKENIQNIVRLFEVGYNVIAF